MTPHEFKTARVALNLSQTELGEIIGLTERAIRNIETGATQKIKPLVEREINRLLAEHSSE